MTSYIDNPPTSVDVNLREHPCQIHPNPIWNNRALGFSEEVAQHKEEQEHQTMNSDMRLAPDLKSRGFYSLASAVLAAAHNRCIEQKRNCKQQKINFQQIQQVQLIGNRHCENKFCKSQKITNVLTCVLRRTNSPTLPATWWTVTAGMTMHHYSDVMQPELTAMSC